MLAPIFRMISDLQNSSSFGILTGFHCHFTRNRLEEYPDAPATQTILPFQSIRMRLTFCSARHDKTSKKMLPLPSNKIKRSGNAT